jgi:hypothetical protein
MAIASIIKQQSFLIASLLTSLAKAVNASLKKPGSQLTDDDHFRRSD